MRFFRRERSGRGPARNEPIPKQLGEFAFSSNEHELKVRHVGASSVASEMHPGRNEDDFFMTGRAIGVFDGVGGDPGSDKASQAAAEIISMILTELDEELLPEDAAEAMKGAFREAKSAIKEMSIEQNDGQPLGTTAVVAGLFTDPKIRGKERRYIQMAHAGDSRAYIIRNDELLHDSVDHSAHPEFGENIEGEIQKIIANTKYIEDLSGRELLCALDRNLISSCLSSSGILSIRTDCVYVQTGDIVLLTSDGIHDNLTTDEILEIVQHAIKNGLSAIELTGLLVKEAQARSGEGSFRSKMDDMTAVVKIID